MTPADSETALLDAAAMQWPAGTPCMTFNTAPARPCVEAPPIAAEIPTDAHDALTRAREALMEGME